MRFVPVSLALVLAPIPAAAETVIQPNLVTDQRCILLGPAVVSGWLNLMRAYAEDDWTDAAEGTRLTESLVTLYQSIGCAVRPLNDTRDSVTSAAFAGASEIDVHESARQCMREAGMPVR
ncbi:MAG: hypothetical protein ACK4OP_05320 [Gemmobacter sp.]